MTRKRASSPELLPLRGIGMRLVFALILVTQLTLAIASIHGVRSPWPVIAALALFVPGLVLVAAPHPEPLPWPRVVALLAISVATNVLVLFNLPSGGWPGYADWSFGAAAWLLFFLALRGRIWSAWIGWLLMAAVAQVWGATIGESPLDALGHVDRHAGTILIAVLFRLLLAATSRRISALGQERLAQVAAEASSLAEIRERSAQAIRLDEDARPALVQIAVGDYVDVERQERYGLLEANLRDVLRGGELISRDVSQAVEDARRRGVEVLLLDDRNEPLSEPESMRVESVLIEELTEFTDGRVTARLLPPGREFFASVVGTSKSKRRRVDLDDQASAPPVQVPPEVV